jgi:hypothetical protein
MSENHNNWSQVRATALRYLRFKSGKRGLNSPFTCPEWGGSSHTLPNHVTGSGRSTRHSRRVITLRPGALLEISFLFFNSSTPIKSIHYFCDWGRRYGQVRFPAIQVHLGFSPFWVRSIRGSVQSWFSTFGVQSIRGWLHSGLGPFEVQSIRGSVHSRLSISMFGLSRFSRPRFSRWIVSTAWWDSPLKKNL